MAGANRGDRIVIGVDFGTTFSGVAETYSGKPAAADEITVIKTWPGGNNGTSDKVPTEIAYTVPKDSTLVAEAEEDGWSLLIDAFDVTSLHAALDKDVDATTGGMTVTWGFQLRPEQLRLRCIKLLLDPHQKMPGFVSSAENQEQLRFACKDAATVVADYLHELYKHTIAELTRRYGKMFVETTDVQWVLTVPAVWSDGAKNATLLAAKQAGMGPDIALISEPEAAAVYTLQAIQPNHLKIGDNFVVVDAGGGTVDLISYEIKQAQPLRIEESVPGSGACCGAALLNSKFEAIVKSMMGDAAFDKMQRTQPKTWLMALKYFEEYVKRNFDPDNLTDFIVPFPGAQNNKAAGIERGFMTLPGGIVASIFKPILMQIVALADEQVKELRKKRKSIAGVVLVGGFGQSLCLYKILKYHFARVQTAENPSTVGRDGGLSIRFDILQPSNAWTAVVRGAVLRGLEGADQVVSRKSRRHYGMWSSSRFDASIHPAESKYWDDLQGEWRAKDRITWFIRKGDTISSTTPILVSFSRTFEPHYSKTVNESIIVCDANVAPDGYEYHHRSNTRVLCKMPVKLGAVPTPLWEKRMGFSGQPYEYLDYKVGVHLESGGLKFDTRVDGVVYGTITATFD